MKRVRVKVHGRVQGVFFRANTQEKADELSVKGWVKNDSEGTVSAIFEGEPEAVDKIVEWCNHGPEAASVDKVEASEEKYTGEFTSFEIKY